jgi:hypothetical protein
MSHRVLSAALLVGLSGCAHRVVVEVAAAPAVAIDASAVAVVSKDRECRGVANALVQQLNAIDGLRVDPRADLRIDVFSCGENYELTLVSEGDDASGETRSRARLDGRSYAVLMTSSSQGVFAHLIGSSQGGASTGWEDHGSTGLLRLRRDTQKRLAHDVAADLTAQLNPAPEHVARRVYPNAPEGTARELHTLAVLAERAGDLETAYYLAEAAHSEQPNARRADYLAELRRRRQRTSSPRP